MNLSSSETIVASTSPFSGGHGVASLEAHIRQVARSQKWDMKKPLPTTRRLGVDYNISNASVSRLLNRLHEEGTIWRRKNGRYFLNASRSLLEKPKPYACLLRQLQSWSRVYQDIMSGFSSAFGSDRTAMLFVHDPILVRHSNTSEPPIHATPAQQKEALTQLFHHHANAFQGILLDEVWLDEVLAEFSDHLKNAVVVCRPTALPELSSVSPDFESGAMLAVSHLYARGFEEIVLAIPFEGAASIKYWTEASLKAAQTIGKPIDPNNIFSVASENERSVFLEQLQKKKTRTGVICLEDNLSVILRNSMKTAGIKIPRQVGILSAMGTELVTQPDISSLLVDYQQIGRSATEILNQNRCTKSNLPTKLVIGSTT